MASPLPGWEKYTFLGPETLAVAIDSRTERCEVLEGELAGKRFNSAVRAARAILATYPGILTALPSAEQMAFPGELWQKQKVSVDSRTADSSTSTVIVTAPMR